jgi:beta-lactamase class A
MTLPSAFWSRLERELNLQIEAVDGLIGICLHDLSTGDGLEIHGDELFPTASTIKLHILTQLYVQAERNELDLTLRPDSTPWHTGGSGVLAYLDEPPALTLRDQANLMIIASDNSATNLCIEQVGMSAVNAMLDDLGLQQTRLRRRMMDTQASRSDVENVATPCELVRMLRLLYHGLPTAYAAERTLAVLVKPKWGFLNQALPRGVDVANKAGWSHGIRCDAGIVLQPRHPYALAIMLNYGLGAPEQLDAAMVGLARTIHQRMSQIAETNAFGHAVFA